MICVSSKMLFQVLPAYHPRSHHPVCLLHEPRHLSGLLTTCTYSRAQGRHVWNRCSVREGFQNQGLSHYIKCHASEDHTSWCGTVVMPPQCSPSAKDCRVPLGRGTNACREEKAALSRLESTREMGPSCILTTSSFTSAEAFVKLPSK